MKISPINNKISFKRNINFMDAHMHDKSIENLGKSADINKVLKFLSPVNTATDTFIPQKIFPSALDCCFYKDGKPYADEILGNEQIIKAFDGTAVDKFIAVCQPKTGKVENIKQLFKNHKDKFVGLKFHPNGAELPADSKLYDSYLDFATEKGLPCLFHSDRTFDTIYPGADGKNYTELKSKFSRPEQIYSLAKRHPKVPVIMAHCGGPEKTDINAAVDVMLKSIENGDAKLYTDISWVGIDDYVKGTPKREMEKLVDVIKRLKNTSKGDMTDRILFGTDAPIVRFGSDNAKEIYKDYISDIHSAIKKNFPDEADELTDKIFYENAKKLFFPDKPEVVPKINPLMKKAPIIALSVAVVAGLTFLGIKAYKNAKNNQNNKIISDKKFTYSC